MKKTNSLYVSSPVNALVKGILREDKTLKEVLELETLVWVPLTI